MFGSAPKKICFHFWLGWFCIVENESCAVRFRNGSVLDLWFYPVPAVPIVEAERTYCFTTFLGPFSSLYIYCCRSDFTICFVLYKLFQFVSGQILFSLTIIYIVSGRILGFSSSILEGWNWSETHHRRHLSLRWWPKIPYIHSRAFPTTTYMYIDIEIQKHTYADT